MDGLGLAMFLPLLQLVADQHDTATTEQMGNMAFILDGLKWLGLKLNLTVVLFTMLFFFTLKGVAKWFESYLGVIYQQFFIRNIRIENINALTHYNYNAFVMADAGVIQNTLSGEVQRVAQGYKAYSKMIQQFVMVITYVALAFMANPEFAALVAIGGTISNFLFGALYKKTKQLSKQLVFSNHAFQSLLIQEVAFFKYLKATGRIQKYAKTLKEKVYEIEDAVKKMGILNSIMMGVREPLMIGIVVAVILIQVNMLGGNLGTIILSLLFFYRGLTSIMSLQTSYNKFLSFSGSLVNMTKFITHLKANKTQTGDLIINNKKEIIFDNISYSYNGEERVLRNIDLSIYNKETLAIVGASGSGKTTLINILSGLLTPTKGRMLIDGVDSREANMAEFQKRIGYITQEAVIFDDTVYNNVTFWAQKSPENLDRFEQALHKASILDFVKELPNQEEARLGNNGINLSGGQKQRISIARELYKNIDLLFMDEATSALDSETERAIQENIDFLKGQITILIIAHRLSTIKNADRVIILKRGEIEQIGTYQELIEKSSSFRRMVELQEL